MMNRMYMRATIKGREKAWGYRWESCQINIGFESVYIRLSESQVPPERRSVNLCDRLR